MSKNHRGEQHARCICTRSAPWSADQHYPEACFQPDHKVIGKQYYVLALVAAFFGMFLSWFMRIHLGWTNAAIPGLQLLSKNGAPGGVITPEFYLQLMTMHGTIMVFFVLTTAPFAAFGNYLPADSGGR